MAISTSLQKAAKLQEKIDTLREQVSSLLVKARAEIMALAFGKETTTSHRSKTPSRRKGRRGPRPAQVMAEPVKRGRKPKKLDGRSKAARALKAANRSPLAGQKRSASPSGPLAPAVVKVLQSKGGPMSVRDILAGLLSAGYKFNTADPKKNLAARVYRLKGVKQVGEGLFATA